MAKARILIIEDETIIAMDIQNMLEEMGYDVPCTAISGDEAIQLAKDLCPDLILMDIVLEGQMDGIEAASKINELFDIPIIYLTAHADCGTMQRANNTKYQGYILKPFNEDELMEAIKAALRDKNWNKGKSNK